MAAGSIVVGVVRLGGPGAAGPRVGSARHGDASAEAGSGAAPRSGPPNVVLITLCSLRADRVGAFGDATAQTPYLDALAAEGVTFTHAWSPATYTLPSHAAIFTGLLPGHAGVLDTADEIGAAVPTLPEVLRDYGYDALAYVPVASLASVHKGGGFERGFDVFIEGHAGGIGHSALAAVRATPEPFFLLAHFKDAHRPYLERMEADSVDPRITEWNRRMATPEGRPPDPDDWFYAQTRADPALATAVSALYDGAVSRADADVGALVEGLRAAGRLDDTVLVIAGDHGEALGEGGHYGHQGFLQPEVLHVPLIVRLPGGEGAGTRVNDDVSLVDLLPTLLDAVGAKAPARIDGRSLLPLVHGDALATRPAIAQSYLPGERREAGPAVVAVSAGDWLFRNPAAHTTAALHDGGDGWVPAASAPEALGAALDQLAPDVAPTTRPITADEKRAVQTQGYW